MSNGDIKKTAFIFPGQASQYVGMAEDLYNEFEAVRRMFDKASEILEYDLSLVCFRGEEDKLRQTIYTQPAVFVHSCALDMILRKEGISAQAAAGHSLGEYSALVSSGALDFNDAVKAIAIRSRAMQEDCEEFPGTMAAVMGMKYDEIVDALAEIRRVVVPANYNSPDQVVIAGMIDAVDEACRKLAEAGAKRAIPIPVGGAYHSPLMDRSSEKMKNYIENEMRLGEFNYPVYSNVDARPVVDADIFKGLLARQISSPVMWYPTMKNMYENGIRRFVEIGPGKVLQGLVKRSLKNPDIEIMGVDSLDSLNVFLRTRARVGTA